MVRPALEWRQRVVDRRLVGSKLAIGLPLGTSAQPEMASVARHLDWLWKCSASQAKDSALLTANLVELEPLVAGHSALVPVEQALELATLCLGREDLAMLLLLAELLMLEAAIRLEPLAVALVEAHLPSQPMLQVSR